MNEGASSQEEGLHSPGRTTRMPRTVLCSLLALGTLHMQPHPHFSLWSGSLTLKIFLSKLYNLKLNDPSQGIRQAFKELIPWNSTMTFWFGVFVGYFWVRFWCGAGLGVYLLCYPGWPQTCSSSVAASQIPGLLARTTRSGSNFKNDFWRNIHWLSLGSQVVSNTPSGQWAMVHEQLLTPNDNHNV